MLTDSSMLIPPPGGVEKLRAKIARETKAENEEKFAMNTLLCFLFFGFSYLALNHWDVEASSAYTPSLVATLESQHLDSQPDLVVSQDPRGDRSSVQISRLTGTPANIKVYLLSQKGGGD